MDNSVPCCITCNFTKRDMLVGDWLAWAERLVTYQRAKKASKSKGAHDTQLDFLAPRLM